MPNSLTKKDCTQYSEKALFNFLNSIKTKQKRALEKKKSKLKNKELKKRSI